MFCWAQVPFKKDVPVACAHMYTIHTHVHAYIYIYIYIYIYTCMHIHIYIYIYIYMHAYIYIYICMHVCIHIHACMHVYMYTYAYTYTYVHVHVHMHWHSVHVCVCVCANVLFVFFWSWSLTSCVLFRFLEIMAEAQAVVHVAPPAVGAQSPGPSSSSGVPASPAKMHPLISRIHPPKKVGDKQMDDDNQSKHHMSIYVINALLQGPEHASGLYHHLKDRQESATSAFGVPPTELFSNLVNLRNLCLPENVVWLISFLASISDMTKQELMLVKDKDSDNFECLVVFAFQIPLTQRCPDELRIMGVMHRLLTARNNECGTRLTTFKATGALQDDGAIDWKFAC